MIGEQEENQNLSNIIQHPSVVLIIGGRGKGKSALGHNLIEMFHKQKLSVYMLILPQLRKKLKELLPKWINLIESIDEAPENCLILCDEAALKYHAHKWQKKETQIMENIISISRHRKQTIIFITHITRKFSITLLDLDVLICKKPGFFHTLIERGGFKKLVEEAEKEFKKLLPTEDIMKYNYVFSEKYTGIIQTGLCSYWSEDLSEAFAGLSLEEEDKDKLFVKTSPKEEYLKDKAIIAHRIANRLGVVATKDPDETIKCFSDAKKDSKNIYEELEPLIEIGKKYCHEENPDCVNCDMNEDCEWFESQL